MAEFGSIIDVVAVCKDGSEVKCIIINRLIRGFRCKNGRRPCKFHIKECDRKYIDDELVNQLIYACCPMSIYSDEEKVVFV